MTFSIIVPVYNVAPYLRAALDSVAAQTYKDWECICIDDGSTDDGSAILDEYAARDNRFRVLHKKNAGVSAARNDGLDLALGEWLCFLDADDLYEAHLLENCNRALNAAPDADLIRFGEVDFQDRSLPDWGTSSPSPEIIIEDISSSFPPSSTGYYFSCRAYRRELIANLRFESHALGEDLLFLYQALNTASRQISIGRVGYGYRQRKNSASHDKVSPTLWRDSIAWRVKLLKLVSSSQKAYSGNFLNSIANGILENCAARMIRFSLQERNGLNNLWHDALLTVWQCRQCNIFQRVRSRFLLTFKSVFWIWIICTMPLSLKKIGLHR